MIKTENSPKNSEKSPKFSGKIPKQGFEELYTQRLIEEISLGRSSLG